MRSLSTPVRTLAVAFAAFGQSDHGAITGTATDPAGAVIAGAPIEAKNTATGAVYPRCIPSPRRAPATTRCPSCRWNLRNYGLSGGLQEGVRTGIEVQPVATFRVDFQLQVGAATESVTITAEAPLLKTESGGLAHNVNVDAMDNLPILTIGSDGAGVRNPLAALLLLPGAQFSSDSILRITACRRGLAFQLSIHPH